jgi:hypothetical protein
MEPEKKAKLENVLQEMFEKWKEYSMKEGAVFPICMVVTEIRLGKKEWRGMVDFFHLEKAQEERANIGKVASEMNALAAVTIFPFERSVIMTARFVDGGKIIQSSRVVMADGKLAGFEPDEVLDGMDQFVVPVWSDC